MLYPSIQDLTNENINRYMLVMATAKAARHITQMAIEAHEASAEKADALKDSKNDVVPTDVNEKAISIAVSRIYNGSYKIIENQ